MSIVFVAFLMASHDRRHAVVGLDDQLHFAFAFFSAHSTAACPFGSSARIALRDADRARPRAARDVVADLVVGRRAQLELHVRAAENGLDLGRLASVSSPSFIFSSNSLRLCGSNDSMIHRTTRMNAAENAAMRVEADAGGQADGQRGEHDAGVLGILDLRAVANQAGRADHAERARQVGADHHHHDGADDRQDDLRLDDGRLARRRAAAPGPQRQRRAEQRGERQPDERRRDLGERIGWWQFAALLLQARRVLRACDRCARNDHDCDEERGNQAPRNHERPRPDVRGSWW